VLREPLLHFLALGIGLFLLFSAVSKEGSRPRNIIVGPGTLESLTATFERTWQRPPTAQELDGLIADYVREEILYREAMALGLDRDDVVVRRRMRQKMELLAAGFDEASEPADAQLEGWLREHPDRYRRETRLGFRQVYLSRERRGARLEGDAARLLETLRGGGTAADHSVLGDPISLPGELRDAPLSEVDRLFGEIFAARLAELPLDVWSGPVESGYGAHLVRVEQRVPGSLPALDQVREAVLRDWQAAQVAAAQEAFYQSLRQGYTVEIERGDEEPGDAADAEAVR
jgi:hypothetical protein